MTVSYFNRRGFLPLFITLTAWSTVHVHAQDSIIEVLLADPTRFSLLADLINATNQTALFNTTDAGWTLFAPTNAAFEALPEGLLSRLRKDSWDSHLESLVSFHVLDSELDGDAIQDGMSKATLAQEDIVFAKTIDGNITVDPGNATVIDANIVASNGIIHAIDAVLTPTFLDTSIYDFTSSLSNFSNLIEMVDFGLLAGTLSTLDMAGNGYTLFAPTNDAVNSFFALKPWRSEDFLVQSDVMDFLLYHIIDGIFTADELQESQSLMASDGRVLNFQNAQQPGEDPAVRVQSATIDSSRLASNGIVHIVDQVVAPFNVVDILNQLDDFFSMFSSMIVHVELGRRFDVTRNFTVFAPVNAAFSEIPADLLTRLRLPRFIAHRKDLVFSHVVDGRVLEIDMITDGTALEARNGQMLSFSVDAMSGITINNSSRPLPGMLDLAAPGNLAIIHGVDALLTPSWLHANLLQVATADGNFDTLVELVSGFDSLVAALTSAEGYTIFAPDDTAFTELRTDFPAEYGVIQDRTEVLQGILSAHFVKDVLTADVLSKPSVIVRSISDELLVIENSGSGLSVNGVPVLRTGVLANNGMIHVLGGVMNSSTYPLDSLAPPAPTASPTSSSTPRPIRIASVLGYVGTCIVLVAMQAFVV
uniref:FAS1 domain-containing protein n=1 Tax=Craspedostauros australis TaxID=1486917 RepID=A0A7R9ZQV5_9STRA|mmetsp:Transcript_6266/g.17025  ORF Transcript_6266/g.17025 Transcript_6266/m.17025 type:complete len:647 (+) Transcript_6266:118-2058(+)